jgi:hypothetical protein
MTTAAPDDGPAGPADFTKMPDPEFLDDMARVRSEIEHAPDPSVQRYDLELLYREMSRELDRRARAIWRAAS